MEDMAFYGTLLAIIAGFWIWELIVSHKMRHHEIQELSGSRKHTPANTSFFASVLQHHDGEQFVTLPVNMAEDADSTSDNLKPGDSLKLQGLWKNSEDIKVYYHGHNVGTLSDYASHTLREMTDCASINGVYVWRKDTLPGEEKDDFEVVVFYSMRPEGSLTEINDGHPAYELRVAGPHPFTLIAN